MLPSSSPFNDRIKIYTQPELGKAWLNKYKDKQPVFTCTLGFTKTALIPNISTAGATPESRCYTAIADAEFLVNGVGEKPPQYPLPPLDAGISPVFISRTVVEKFKIPTYVFNAGVLTPPSVKHIDLQGQPAQCVSTGQALPLSTVKHLYEQGLEWGRKLAQNHPERYLILSECVVAGTTTALGVLTALGISAKDKVNSSHPVCNHQQKWDIVQQGLKKMHQQSLKQKNDDDYNLDPFTIVSGIGDPMQIVVAGMAISASQTTGVMLAGGTQMLAVFALIKALAKKEKHKEKNSFDIRWENIIVGTTRWVAEDPTGDTIGLASLLENVCVCATQLNFSTSNYESLRKYEAGFVKEGVGAGGSAICAHLLGLDNQELLILIEAIISRFQMVT